MSAEARFASHPSPAWGVRDDEPFLTGSRVPAGIDIASISLYGDAKWRLTPLNRRRHRTDVTVNWEKFPLPFVAPFRRAGWLLANLPTPDPLLNRLGTRRVEWVTDTGFLRKVTNWRRFATWLVEHGTTSLSQVTVDNLTDYARYVAALRLPASMSINALYSISLLWGHGPQLPPDDRIPMPPWEVQTMADYLRPDAGAGENTTAVIHPATMAPLLVWALRFVDDLSDDIDAAWQERQRLLGQVRVATNPAAQTTLTAYLDTCAATGTALPGQPYRDRGYGVANLYLAALHHTSHGHVINVMARYDRTRLTVDTEAPLATPINGRLQDRPWRTHINFYDAPILMGLLDTACLIVICYLSGLRPGEALNLQVGCCPEPTDDDGAIRYQLHGHSFKGARDADGKPAPDGAARALPWTVIAPVARAVRVLERHAHNQLLFSASSPWRAAHTDRRELPQAALTCFGANARIRRFVAWINSYTETNNLPHEAIPDDSAGPLHLVRFRRTIAWHIARLPGGSVALAIQYGHLRTTFSEGYSGRARQGLRQAMDIETARAMADYLADVGERLRSGEGVSGPAATRLVSAAKAAQARFAGKYLSPKDARDLLTDPRLQVYDNPEAFLTCNYDPATALCNPERGTPRTQSSRTPSLDRCDSRCANIARTDQHTTHARQVLGVLEEEASNSLTPIPLRERTGQRITALRQLIDRHEQARSPAGPEDVNDQR